MACFNENKRKQSITNNLRVLIYCPKCQECLLWCYHWFFTGAITWASRKLINLINHNTACTTLIQWNIPVGAKWHRVFRFAPGSVQNGSIPYLFYFFLYLKNMIIYAYISWLNTCLAIVSRFLPNIMIIGWILSLRGINFSFVMPFFPDFLYHCIIAIITVIIKVLSTVRNPPASRPKWQEGICNWMAHICWKKENTVWNSLISGICNDISELRAILYYLIHSRLFLNGQFYILNWVS